MNTWLLLKCTVSSFLIFLFKCKESNPQSCWARGLYIHSSIISNSSILITAVFSEEGDWSYKMSNYKQGNTKPPLSSSYSKMTVFFNSSRHSTLHSQWSRASRMLINRACRWVVWGLYEVLNQWLSTCVVVGRPLVCSRLLSPKITAQKLYNLNHCFAH